MAEVCANCGKERKTKQVEVPPPSEGVASFQTHMCSDCVTKTGAKPVK